MKEVKFYRCNVCGNMVGLIKDGGGAHVCCGQPMELLVPGTVDASREKHLPAVSLEGDTVSVQVGSALHPMLPEHSIEWIYLQTEKGGQRRALSPGDDPKADFTIRGDRPVAVYEYCSLHGLWKQDV